MLKTVLTVAVAAGVGTIVADKAYMQLTKVDAVKNLSPDNSKAVKFGLSAGSTILLFMVVHSFVK